MAHVSSAIFLTAICKETKIYHVQNIDLHNSKSSFKTKLRKYSNKIPYKSEQRQLATWAKYQMSIKIKKNKCFNAAKLNILKYFYPKSFIHMSSVALIKEYKE